MQADCLNVFDLDGTLIKVNSFKEISKALVFTLVRKRKFVSLLNLSCWYWVRKLGFIRHLRFKEKITRVFDKELTKEEKRDLVQAIFFANINQGVFELMDSAENCVISTAAPSAFVSWMPLKKNIVVISSLDHDSGFPDPANYGSGKLENLKYYFKEKTITVSNFYTDSIDDQCLIDFSINAFMVTNGGITKVK